MMDTDFIKNISDLHTAGDLKARNEAIQKHGGMGAILELALIGAKAKAKQKQPRLFEEHEPTKRATRWPADRKVPSEWIDSASARREKAGLPSIDLRAEVENFVTYWPAVAGKAGCKTNWKLTFENSCLRARAPIGPYGKLTVISGGAGPFENAKPEGWVIRLAIFYGHDDDCPRGTWRREWGPTPSETGCRCPSEAFAAYEARYGKIAARGAL